MENMNLYIIKKIEGRNIGEILQEWDKSQTRIRKWHHLQPKTLRH